MSIDDTPNIRQDPTTRAAWLVKGETELGPQRRCRDCAEWYPLDRAFWIAQAYRTRRGSAWCWEQPCRACQQPARAEAARRHRARMREQSQANAVAPDGETPYGSGGQSTTAGGS